MFVPAPTAAVRATSILLREIMHYMNLWDILRVMGVNRLWRKEAINHPTYYGSLRFMEPNVLSSLDEYTFDNVDFFLLRLRRSAKRPISVYVELGERTPSSVIREIGNHLAHITSLSVAISSANSAASIVGHLCRPAPILRNLSLQITDPNLLLPAMIASVFFPDRPWPPCLTLPADFLAGRAPVLDSVRLSDFDLSSGIPQCFAHIRKLSFCSFPNDLILPDLAERCPQLQELHLSKVVRMHPVTRDGSHSWNRMTKLTFSEHVACWWPAFGLPLNEVQTIHVSYGDAASSLALAETLSGPLHVAFPQLRRARAPNVTTYSAYLRAGSTSDDSSAADRMRFIENDLLEHDSISAFSARVLTDRIVRLDLPLDAWEDLVGLSTFGPFNALEELGLTFYVDDEFPSAAASKLSCPHLQRLILLGQERELDFGALTNFALAALPDARFPLRLKLEGNNFNLSGTSSDSSGRLAMAELIIEDDDPTDPYI